MTWTATTDRAAPWLIQLGWAVVRRGGWAAGRLITLGAVAWFLVSAPRARRASRDYLARVLGRPASTREIAHHFDRFASAVLDRVMLLSGRERDYAISVDGLPALLATLAEGRGVILLGAHLGSFEVLRTLARNAPAPVWALMYRRNNGALAALLDRIAPDIRARVLEIGDTASMIRARECVERGEIVGILADRSPPGHRLVPARFLGGTAHFPSGPFVLAATLGAPVFLFHGVSTGHRRYHIGIEPFADRVRLRREHRQDDLRAQIQRYAAGIERLCRAHPFQWFNFFPFWESDHEPDPAPHAGPAARSQLERPS